jgi:hypothetical protein
MPLIFFGVGTYKAAMANVIRQGKRGEEEESLLTDGATNFDLVGFLIEVCSFALEVNTKY